MNATVSPADPLSKLTAYEIRFLVTHLAAANRDCDLHRLLSLRRGDGANAWYAAKDDAAAYLRDLDLAWASASTARDLGRCARYALLTNGVRRAATVPGRLLRELVARGRLSFGAALSLAQSSAQLPDRIDALAGLLPVAPGDQRVDVARQVLDLMNMSSDNRSTIGFGLGGGSPLEARRHVETIAALAAAGGVAAALGSALIATARRTPTSYAAAEALATVAAALGGGAGREAGDDAWAAASALGRFQGLPEAQALVAVRTCGVDRARVDVALESALDALGHPEERLRHTDWAPYGETPPFRRARTLRLNDFAAPLRELAPVLDAGQVRRVVSWFSGIRDAHASFAVIAVLPRLAELEDEQVAWGLAAELPFAAPLAVAELAARRGGFPFETSPEELVKLAARSGDRPLRALVQATLVPLLPETSRVAAIEELLAGTVERDDTPEGRDLRAEILDRLLPSVRALPAREQALVVGALATAEERLVRSAREAEDILGRLVEVLPTPQLEARLNAARSVALESSAVDRIRRPEPKAHEPPARAEPLPADVAAEAVAVARDAGAAPRAEILLFLASILRAGDRQTAFEAANAIPQPHLRAVPLLRLAEVAVDAADAAAARTAAVRAVLQATGGLGRLQETIDGIAARLDAARDDDAATAVDAFLHSIPPDEDIAAALPIARALGPGDVGAAVEDAIAERSCWFGPSAESGPAKPGSTSVVAPLVLDEAAGGSRLVATLAQRARWRATGALLSVLAARSPGSAALEEAERAVVEQAVAAAGDEPRQLLEHLSERGPSHAGRARATAALLQVAIAAGDGESVAARARRAEASAGELPRDEQPRLRVDLLEASLLLGDTAAAAGHLDVLLELTDPYSPETGRVAARAARLLERALDDGPASVPAGEGALRRYLELVARNAADYALQEAAGDLLAARVAAATTRGRPVDPEWLARLDALADADDPAETLLHRLALGAVCDAAAAAVQAGDRAASERHTRSAVARWRRHPELTGCTQRLATLLAAYTASFGAADLGLAADELSSLGASAR